MKTNYLVCLIKGHEKEDTHIQGHYPADYPCNEVKIFDVYKKCSRCQKDLGDDLRNIPYLRDLGYSVRKILKLSRQKVKIEEII